MTTTGAGMTRQAQRQDALIWAARPHRTLWRDALSRLVANRLAMFGLFFVLLFTAMAIFAPILAPYPYDKADFTAVSQFPTWTGKYPLGTDLVGRDMLSRLIWGAQVSMAVGLGAQVLVFLRDLYCDGDPACFAKLGMFTPDLDVVPDIAERWEPNADASVWTFYLRKNSYWSNGDPVTAHDYEWSWKRQLDPATAAPYAGFLYDIKNAEAFNTQQPGVTRDDVGVKALDDYTLQVTLEGPRGYFPILAT